MVTPSLFLLGATGYVGGELLLLLAREMPQSHVIAVVRPPAAERTAELQQLHPNISTVEATLNDLSIIEDQSEKADIVINVASSDNAAASKAIVTGLKKRSRNKPGELPLYIHISGLGILSDDAHGNLLKTAKVWSDIGLDLKSLPQGNIHLNVDIPLVEAGARKEGPIRTIILFPGAIYGVGRGVKKTTGWLKAFLYWSKTNGYAGTWGNGENAMSNIHVRDVASAIGFVLKLALEHKADEGPEGLYFVASDALVKWREWQAAMGDYLFEKDVIAESGTRPFSEEFINSVIKSSNNNAVLGWRLFGGNQLGKADRLAKFGWEPTETAKHPMLECLIESVDLALQS